MIESKKDGISQNEYVGTWSSITKAGEAMNLNLTYIKDLDPLNVKDLTKAEIQGRKDSLDALKGLQKKVPGFEHSKLRNFGMTIGIRDSRKIIGKYNLSAEDVTQQGRFDDSIGIFPEFVDGYNVLLLPTTGRYFQIPLRCLQVEPIENLLVAGRCVAGDRISHAAMRNMMACAVTGQGAGVAAATAVKNKRSIKKTPYIEIRKELQKQGVLLI